MKRKYLAAIIMICLVLISCQSQGVETMVPEQLKIQKSISSTIFSDAVDRMIEEDSANEEYSPYKIEGLNIKIKEPKLIIRFPSDDWEKEPLMTYFNEGSYGLFFKKNSRTNDGPGPSISIIVEHIRNDMLNGPFYLSTWTERGSLGTIDKIWTDETDKISLKKSVVLKTQTGRSDNNQRLAYRVFWANESYGVHLILEASLTEWDSVLNEYNDILFNLAVAQNKYQQSHEFYYIQQNILTGRPEDQVALGKAYFFGDFGPPNIKRAAKWFNEAADQRWPIGQYFSGLIALYGPQAYKDVEKGEQLLLDAAHDDCEEAQYQLGNFYLYNKESPDHYSSAFHWFSIALRNYYIPAAYELARLYEQGNGIKKDFEMAFVLYQRAAEEGYPPAQYKLAQIYNQGVLESENQALARAYWMLSAAQGIKKADQKLQQQLEILSEEDHLKTQQYLEIMMRDFAISEVNFHPNRDLHQVHFLKTISDKKK